MKASEVHKLNNEELRVEDERLRKQLFELRTQAVTEQLENHHQMRDIRRDVARIQTEIRSRKLQEAKKA